MESHIGLNYKFREGSEIPSVDENATKLIREFIRNIKFERAKELDKKGESMVEYDYMLCKSPEHADKLFVVSIRIKYLRESLQDTEYGVYAFDATGNPIEFERENCKGNFYRNMMKITEV